MKPANKIEWVNLPLSLPKPWRDWIDNRATFFCGSRNHALFLAIKFGAPLLGKHIEIMRAELKAHYDRLGAVPTFPGKNSENLGAPELPVPGGISAVNENRDTCNRPNRRKRKH